MPPSLLTPDDLIPLGRVFASNVDDANFAGRSAHLTTALEALRRGACRSGGCAPAAEVDVH